MEQEEVHLAMRKNLLVVSFLTVFCLNGFAQKNELAVIAGAKITPKVGSTTNQTTFATNFAIEGNYATQLAHVPAVHCIWNSHLWRHHPRT